MSQIILYLDKPTEAIEKQLGELCPEGMTVKFLQPLSGPAGTPEEADFILVATHPVDRPMIGRFRKVKLIQKTGIGYDNIDAEAAAEVGIPVAITAGANAVSVAELVILYILALYRRLLHLDRTTKEGQWEMWAHRHHCFELYGKTLGVIGMGQIGRALTQRAQAFGVEVIYHDLFRLPADVEAQLGVSYREFEDLMEEADIVSLHVPSSPDTKGLIGEKALRKMKPEAILINTSRGPVVDQAALARAIREGWIAGAGLDVYDPEPPEKGSEILGFENVITTPHIGAGTIDTFRRVISMCMDNFVRVSRGTSPRDVVNNVS